MPTPRIGCHLSLGAKPEISLAVAASHGVECVQVFASSPAAWKPPVQDAGRDAEILRARLAHEIHPLFIHAIYLINLASEDPVLARRSRDSLVVTLEAAARLGANGVITHLGSHLGRGFEPVAAQVGAGLLNVLERAPAGVDLILENSAGAGGVIGSTLEELAELLRQVDRHGSVKIALDTAHLCGAGWEFAAAETTLQLVKTIRDTVGMDRLAVIHANDSKVPAGSRRDRHASIGDGHIGVEGFRFLMGQSQLQAVPWICETPDLGSATVELRYGSVRQLHTLARQAQPELAQAQR